MAITPPKPNPDPPTVQELEARIRNLEGRLESKADLPDARIRALFEGDTARIDQLSRLYGDIHEAISKQHDRLAHLELERKLRTAVELFTVARKVKTPLGDELAGEATYTLRAQPFPIEIHSLEIAFTDPPLLKCDREALAKLVRFKRATLGYVDFCDGAGALDLEKPLIVTHPSCGVQLVVTNDYEEEVHGAFVYRYLELRAPVDHPSVPFDYAERASTLVPSLALEPGEWFNLAPIPPRDGTLAVRFECPYENVISTLEIEDPSGEIFVDQILRNCAYKTLKHPMGAAARIDGKTFRFDLAPFNGGRFDTKRIDVFLRNPTPAALDKIRARILWT